ncbi:MAG: NapC/NirT family cytochrome c [Phycisphaerales bacterium]|nr:NapC/NirT family cytochrome c [Phycisphaerales bacterium]
MAGVTVLAMLIVGAASLGAAEYYTGRPQFCGSCHVMDPYYESWSHDLHGAKIGARCIDCHYAPGERLTFRAKFKGLSQVASYFSGRYGAGRPRAHVADESCLTSPCHGDERFMAKKLPVGQLHIEKRIIEGHETEIERAPTVSFYHEKHLHIDDKLTGVQKELETVTARLRNAIPGADFDRVIDLTRSVAPAHQRTATLDFALKELDLSAEVCDDAHQLLQLEHRHTRLKQLDGVSCATCHNYDPSGENHIAVHVQNCFTCHFTNEGFNEGAGECLKCHEPPTRTVFVHGGEGANEGASVLMDHRDLVARKVDCSSCHLDVIRGASTVSIRECQHCHDSDRFLGGFETRTTETVEKYHEEHVAHQRARCDDCHQSVSHALLDPMRVTTTGFLEPVLNDCQHCHPGHHTEQVQMLSGVGGAGVTGQTPNAMLGSRLNCRACHVQSAADDKGESVVKASEQSCVACHSQDYARLFEQQQDEIAAAMREAKGMLARLEERLATEPDALTSADRDMLEVARKNIRFVEIAGGMHNKHFAVQLLDAARRDLAELEARLASPQ